MLKRIIKKIEQIVLEWISVFFPLSLLVVFLKLYGFKVKTIEKKNGIYRFEDTYGEVIWFTRIHRVLRYKNGVLFKLSDLQKEYLTDNLKFGKEDVIVDVGANVGEYTMFWEKRGCKCISLEPDHTEFIALKKNVDKGTIFNMGAWHSQGELIFYHKNETADSSLIETSNFDYKSKIEVITLDLALDTVPVISLLKLEAEGAEPEVIQGSKNVLLRTKYITVDVGEERGVNEESTLPDVVNSLIPLGFKVIDINFSRGVLLLKSTR